MSDHVLGLRIARHGFADRPATSTAGAAHLVCAIQAQDVAAARLGVRARARHVTDAEVRQALEVDRTVARTWLMRNTIHLVPAADLRWLVAQFGPMIQRRFGSVRWPQLGLTPSTLARAAELAPDALAVGPLTRHELADALRERGVVIPDDVAAATHLVVYLASVGLVCHAADRGRDSTFALVEDWLAPAPSAPTGDDGLAELARRFFRAFSPATAADFTTWSGLPSSRAVALIRDELTAIDVDGRPGFSLGEVEPGRGLRLLPAFDNYLIGYRDRAPMIDAARRAEVYVGGVIRPTVLLDGRVAGRWRLVRTPAGPSVRRATIEVMAFETLRGAARHDLDREIEDIGRFLGVDARPAITDA